MKIRKKVDLGEYVIKITYSDDGSGYLKVAVFDELQEEIEFLEITNDVDNDEIDPNLN